MNKLLLIGLALLLLLPIGVIAGDLDYFYHGYKFDNTNDVNLTENISGFSNTPFVAGKIGNAMLTSAPAVRSENNFAWTGGGSLTSVGWFRLNGTLASSNNATIFEKTTGSWVRLNRIAIQNLSGTYRVYYQHAGNSTLLSHYGNASTLYNVWVNVAVVFNHSNNNATLYINGQPVNSSFVTNGTGGALSGGTAFGNDRSSTATPFTGLIDAWYFWNYPLTPNAICLMNNQTNGAENPMSGLSCSTDVSFNASITLYDFYNSTPLTSFNVFENNTLIASTTNGTANLPYLKNSSSLYNLVLNSTQSGGYLNLSRPAQNVSGTMNFPMSQSIINFYGVEKITGSNLSGVNFTTIYATNTTHYMNVATYQVNTSKAGYYQRSITYTPVALSSTTQNVSYLYNQILMIGARAGFTSSAISAFTVTISNSNYSYSETIYTTTGTATFNVISNLTYNISVNVSGYLSNSTTHSSTSNVTALNVTLYADNHIIVNFFDENTLLAVPFVDWQLIGNYYSQNGTTGTNGIANITSISSDNYELRYWNNNYTYRSLFFDIPAPNISGVSFNAYMINTSVDTSFVVKVTDKNNRPIARNLVVDILRRYPISGATYYYVVEMTKPTIALQGNAPFVAMANSIPYLFRVRDLDNDEVLFQGSGTTGTGLQTYYLIDSTFYIKINIEADPFTASKELRNLSYSLTDTGSSFWLSVSDPSFYVSQYCLKVTVNRTTLISNNCSTSNSPIIGVSYPNSNGSLYIAQFIATASTDRKTYLVDQILVDNTAYGIDWGYSGLFFLLLSLIAIGVGFQEKPMVGVIMGGIAFLGFGITALGGLWYSPTSALIGGSIFVISLIVAFIMSDN